MSLRTKSMASTCIVAFDSAPRGVSSPLGCTVVANALMPSGWRPVSGSTVANLYTDDQPRCGCVTAPENHGRAAGL